VNADGKPAHLDIRLEDRAFIFIYITMYPETEIRDIFILPQLY